LKPSPVNLRLPDLNFDPPPSLLGPTWVNASIRNSAKLRNMDGQSTLERAFELARQGRVHTVEEIRRQLTAENFEMVGSHLAGPSVRKQITALIKAATLDRRLGRCAPPEMKRDNSPIASDNADRNSIEAK
jgi:hypothetical protein